MDLVLGVFSVVHLVDRRVRVYVNVLHSKTLMTLSLSEHSTTLDVAQNPLRPLMP